MKVKIITDVISDISPDVANDYGIEVMPIKITIDGKNMSPTDISVEGLVEWVEKNKKIPSFKGVSCDEYINTFGKYVNQGYAIVCLTAGSQAISNFDCALYASTQFPNANIQVLNTNRFSGNVGLLAILAAKMAMNMRSANEIAIACERNIEKNKQAAFYDGQVKSAEYFISNVLPITLGKMNAVENTNSAIVEIAEASFGG